jgi:hypothetical protein
LIDLGSEGAQFVSLSGSPMARADGDEAMAPLDRPSLPDTPLLDLVRAGSTRASGSR